jgi:putative transposase
MIVRYDPRDLSRIYLLGPDDTYYDLSYRDLRRPPISLWEHRLALKRLREEGQAHVDETAIFRAVEAMRAIADDAVRATKTVRRQRERRRRVVSPALCEPAVELNPKKPARFGEADASLEDRIFPFEEWS